MKYLLTLFLCLASVFHVHAQSLSLFDVDASNFPTMKAKFYAFDAGGKQQRPSASEMTLSENGKKRLITSVSCPQLQPPKELSSVLIVDVSGSMGDGSGSTNRITLAKTTATSWVNGLPLGVSECAITSFDGANYLNQDFTTDRSKLLTAIAALTPKEGTDYDAALIKPMASGLKISLNAQHKKIIVLLTDGLGDGTESSIITEANRQNCTIYCIAVGMSAPNILKNISTKTGGQYFEDITTIQEAEEAYFKILQIAQEVAPCEITWTSDVVCEVGRTSVEAQWQSTTYLSSYILPAAAIASLAVSPVYVPFGAQVPASVTDRKITLTANNADVTVTGIVRQYGSLDFSVLNTTFPLNIPKNTSKTLTLRFVPSDSAMCYVSYEILNNLCPASLSASGGFPGKKMKVPTLKLTYPNGGESFVVGSDTLITWEGIAKTDTVVVEYSIDNGITWKYITMTASNLQYIWKNIPKPPSNQCKIRIKQTGNSNSGTSWKAGTVQYNLLTHWNQVTKASWSPDGTKVATGSDDYTAIVWSALTGAKLLTLDGHRLEISDLCWSPDGTKIATASYDATNIIWSAITGAKLLVLADRTNYALSVCWSPDGTKVATSNCDLSGTDNHTANIWSATTGTKLFILKGHTAYLKNISWSPDGTKVATASDDYTAKIWSVANGSNLLTLKGHIRAVNIVTWSPDGTKVATTSNDGTAIIWSPTSGLPLFTLNEHRAYFSVWDANWSPDGTKIATIAADTLVIVWSTTTGAKLFNLKGHTNVVYGIDWSHDGTKIATAGKDGKVIIWSTTDGSKLFSLIGHNGAVHRANWSPNDSKIATASDDHSAKIWYANDAPLQVDSSDDVFKIVAPNVQANNVDLKQCIVGSVKDTLLPSFTINTGSYKCRVDSIYFTGSDAGAFALVSGIPRYELTVGASKAAEFRFKPKRVGLHSATINIITQSDTLQETITGEGTAPLLTVINNFIDFGKVPINSTKDTLQAVTIKNIGTAPLTITATRFAGPNDVDYSSLTGGGAFTLAVGETARLDLRFVPKDSGRTNGQLLFDYNGIGSPAAVQLFGEGIKRGARIASFGGNFPQIVCENERIDSLRILNKGTDTLVVSSIIIGGLNPTDFQLSTPFVPSQVISGNVLLVPIKFVPSTTGNRSATIEVHSNSLTDSILTISLSGHKDIAAFSTNTRILDIGTLCPNQLKDTTLTLTNTGSLRNLFRVQSSSLLRNTAPILLDSAEKKLLLIRFSSRATEGNINEMLTITDSICGSVTSIQVIGTIQLPSIASQPVADFGKIAIADSAFIEVVTVNNGSRPIVVSTPQGILPPFTLVSLTPPVGNILAPQDTLKAKIRFNPINVSQSVNHIKWSFTVPCTTNDSSELRGVGVRADTARTTVSIQDISAQAGEKVNLTLKLQKPSKMEIVGAPTDWYARIHYNKSILFNEQTSNVCPGTTDSCVLELTGVYNPKTDELLSIPCIATLGNTDHSTIVIDTFFWKNSALVTEVVTQNGSITLNGICADGGVRLFIPANTSTSLSTRPNPARDKLQIQYGLREPLTVTLELLTMTGQVAQTIVNNQAQAAGQFTVMSDLSTLGNGVYQLRLRTNKETLTTRVDIVK